MRYATILITLLALATGVRAETIAIIGTGNVGSALGPEFAAQGHTVIYGSREPRRDKVAALVAATGNGSSARTPAEAVAQADVVVLAVPGTLVAEIAGELGDLAGKIVIDPSNPIRRTETGFEHAVDTSNTVIIQSIAPAAEVVKAFNTLSWELMVDPSGAGGPVSIPLAGDSERAKAFVARLARGMGLEPIDVGPASYARWLEGMAILLINNAYGSYRPAFNFHLRRLP